MSACVAGLVMGTFFAGWFMEKLHTRQSSPAQE
jgi:hypothetical protein